MGLFDKFFGQVGQAKKKSKMDKIVKIKKIVVHDGSDPQTVLPAGAIECVMDNGNGMNFFSMEDLDEFLMALPTSEDQRLLRSALLAAKEQDPTFENVDAVIGIDLTVPGDAATISATVITP